MTVDCQLDIVRVLREAVASQHATQINRAAIRFDGQCRQRKRQVLGKRPVGVIYVIPTPRTFTRQVVQVIVILLEMSGGAVAAGDG